MSSKIQFIGVLAVCVFAISLTGCRNRCQPCGGAFQQPNPNFYGYNNPAAVYAAPGYAAPGYAAPGGFPAPNAVAGRAGVIAPPPTGSLTIPSLARNNPFGVNPNRGLINTQQQAPTPANRSARFNSQNGWQPVDGRASQPNNGQSNTGQPGSTRLGSNSGAEATGGSRVPAAGSSTRPVLVQDTQSRANRGYGDSFVSSPNYSTTAVNETFDRTRLPATDASGVRAPSQYYARATGVQVAQIPGQIAAGVQQPYYNSGIFRAQNQAAYNVAAGTIQPGLIPAAVVASRGNVIVQDQATASYDPYSNSRSADWRNRDAASNTFQ